MENIDIPEYEIEGLLQTLKELGIKGIMEWSDVLVLNHLGKGFHRLIEIIQLRYSKNKQV